MRTYLLFMASFLILGGGCMVPDQPVPNAEPTPVFRVELPSGASRPLMIAHRCGAGLGPENTRGAVIQSSFYRPDYYEIDIRHTSDGVPVAFHDPALDRTTNMSGNISDMSWEEIEFADAGSWYGSAYSSELIPTFERLLDGVNPSPLCIELKEQDISESRCENILRLLYERNDYSSVILSLHRDALQTFRQAEDNFQSDPSAPQSDFSRRTCYLATSLDDFAITGPHEIVGILHESCTEEIVEEIHASGKACWVWTVDEPADLYRFRDMEVDGIVTNYPDRLRNILPPS